MEQNVELQIFLENLSLVLEMQIGQVLQISLVRLQVKLNNMQRIKNAEFVVILILIV